MSDTTILQNSTHVIKPKKSVALSGVPAGNTALCTVGKSGNDLHYRGYDILDLAEHCEFEEVAHLLIHGKLPTRGDGERQLHGHTQSQHMPCGPVAHRTLIAVAGVGRFTLMHQFLDRLV